MTLKTHFLENEVFDNLLREIPRKDGKSYEDLKTAYSDMSRMVVAWLADDELQTAVDNELMQAGAGTSDALSRSRRAAKEWMKRFGPRVVPRRNGPSFINSQKFREWTEEVFGSSKGWEEMYAVVSLIAANWLSQLPQNTLQEVYNGFGWKIANVRQMKLVAQRWLSLQSSPKAADIRPPSNTRVLVEEYRIVRDTPLARSIKSVHDHRCQICGQTISLPSRQNYSEAHHIQPLGEPHNGPDISGNIVVLCPNHHVMCDYGCIKIAYLQGCKSLLAARC